MGKSKGRGHCWRRLEFGGQDGCFMENAGTEVFWCFLENIGVDEEHQFFMVYIVFFMLVLYDVFGQCCYVMEYMVFWTMLVFYVVCFFLNVGALWHTWCLFVLENVGSLGSVWA